MKNTSIINVLALSLATTTLLLLLLTGGDACKGVSSMSVTAACRMASVGKKPAMLDFCMEALRETPPESEATAYALEVVYAVQDSYAATKRLMNDSASFPSEVWPGVGDCIGEYENLADLHMVEASRALELCWLEDVMQEDYAGAVAAIGHCVSGLPRPPPAGATARLYGMALADIDRTWLAASLARLVVANKTAA